MKQNVDERVDHELCIAYRPPKGSGKKKQLLQPTDSEPSSPVRPLSSPSLLVLTVTYRHAQTLAEQLSYLHSPRPFKNPAYTKNVNRRAKNLKAVLTQERERERVERERRRVGREERMDVDGAEVAEEDLPTCKSLASALG